MLSIFNKKGHLPFVLLDLLSDAVGAFSSLSMYLFASEIEIHVATQHQRTGPPLTIILEFTLLTFICNPAGATLLL